MTRARTCGSAAEKFSWESADIEKGTDPRTAINDGLTAPFQRGRRLHHRA